VFYKRFFDVHFFSLFATISEKSFIVSSLSSIKPYFPLKNDFLSSKQKAVISGHAIKLLLNRSLFIISIFSMLFMQQ
jgi:hypothetical protein